MAGAKRLWFVIPNELKGDGKEWRSPDNQQVRGEFRGFEDAPRPARARANVQVDEPIAVDNGYGFGVSTSDAKGIMAFTTKTKAEEYARHQASMNPQKLFGVFECSQMFETTVPQVITKQFNDAGELVLKAEV